MNTKNDAPADRPVSPLAAPVRSPISRDGRVMSLHDYSRNALIDTIERGIGAGADDFGRPLPVPYSAVSGNMYHGQNIFHLASIARERGYESGAWCTYQSASRNGWQVNKGERGARVYLWKQQQFQTEQIDEVTGEPETITRPVLMSHVVFNTAQMDTSKGKPVPPGPALFQVQGHSSDNVVGTLDRIADEMGVEVEFRPGEARSRYENGVVIVAAEHDPKDPRSVSQLALGLLDVGLSEGLRSRKRPKDEEVLAARGHLRQVMAESLLSMRLGFPIEGTQMDANKVMLAVGSSKQAGSQDCVDAEAAVRYMLSFDPNLADHLKAEGQALYDEVLDAAGEQNMEVAFDASMIDFGYVEDRLRPGVKP